MARTAITVQVVNGSPYVVPAGKTFVGVASETPGMSVGVALTKNGANIWDLHTGGKFSPLTANAGDTFSAAASVSYFLNGFLFDQ